MKIVAKFIKEVEVEVDDKYKSIIQQEINYDNKQDYDNLWMDVANQVCPNAPGNNLKLISSREDYLTSGLLGLEHNGKIILER